VGTSFFLDVLDEFAASDGYSCAIDVGCNDFFFLQELGDRALTRVGIDPIWAGREDEFESGIEVIGTTVEDANLAFRLDHPPDLIALRHTIEHIDDPLGMVQVLADAAADDAIFLFETPGFDALVRRNRFDQIFHQHVQYFTIGSLRRMMESVGLEYLGHRENYHDFGAFAAVFRKSAKRTAGLFTAPPIWTSDDIRQHHGLFKQQMGLTSEVLNSLGDGVIYGYGAANLLPVMAYHLETDLGFIDAVLDDDPAKDGMAYWNLSVEIRHAAKAGDLSQSTVVITAVDNVAPIMARLLQKRPRHIVYPLTVI
jgi:SAM-dependent methyltransferase